jgi:hypothetical protein
MIASLLHRLALSALLKTARDKINIKTALFFILQISNKITSPLCHCLLFVKCESPSPANILIGVKIICLF